MGDEWAERAGQLERVVHGNVVPCEQPRVPEGIAALVALCKRQERAVHLVAPLREWGAGGRGCDVHRGVTHFEEHRLETGSRLPVRRWQRDAPRSFARADSQRLR